MVAVSGVLLTSASPAFSQNWTLTSAPQTNWTSIASSADGNRLVASAWGFSSFAGGRGGPIYTSTNAGVSWMSALPTNLETRSFLDLNWWSIASSADGIKLFAVGWPPGDNVYAVPISLSSNAGATWTNTGTFNGVWHFVAASGDGSKLAAAEPFTDHNLHISTDSGATWSQTSVTNAQYAAWSADGKTLVAAQTFWPCQQMAEAHGCTPASRMSIGQQSPLQWMAPSSWQSPTLRTTRASNSLV